MALKRAAVAALLAGCSIWSAQAGRRYNTNAKRIDAPGILNVHVVAQCVVTRAHVHAAGVSFLRPRPFSLSAARMMTSDGSRRMKSTTLARTTLYNTRALFTSSIASWTASEKTRRASSSTSSKRTGTCGGRSRVRTHARLRNNTWRRAGAKGYCCSLLCPERLLLYQQALLH